MSTAPVPKLLYTIPDACTATSFSRVRVFALMKSGALPTVLVGRRRFIEASALTDCIERLKTESAEAEKGREAQRLQVRAAARRSVEKRAERRAAR